MKKTIIIFGFSGSGKTTMAKRLSKNLKLRLIHPSGILRAICLGGDWKKYQKLSNRGFWENEVGRKILQARLAKDTPPDKLCDEIILKEARKSDVVIDSWSLPWIFQGGLKIYLRASLKTRANRVARRSNEEYQKTRRLVWQKDRDTRFLYQRISGFDIAKDHEVFDLIINTENLSKEEVEEKILSYVKNY
ncbi:MAG: cytidylate kinase family protein [Candidatus Falkowbacteria bacterium]|nr:cytidylate kinase family protein [Candidatus Falkowbacteria bacterium]